MILLVAKSDEEENYQLLDIYDNDEHERCKKIREDLENNQLIKDKYIYRLIMAKHVGFDSLDQTFYTDYEGEKGKVYTYD